MRGPTAAVPRTVHLVLPAGVDDPAAPSGGNAYDRRIRAGLPVAGWAVEEVGVAGDWPRPDAAARTALDRALAVLPDGAVVLVDGLVACGVPDVVVPHARRLALVVLVHLPLGDESGGGDLARGEGTVLRAATAVVATSPWTARRVAAVHGVPAARVHVAPPGVDPAPVAAGTDGAGRLLCVGAVTPTKGHDVLVEALAGLASLAWTCDVVGPLARDPAFVARLREAVAHHGLTGRVRLAGPLAGEALAGVYAAADLLVLPSRTEAYGMVLTEALARGVPVVATATGGVPETLDGDGPLPGVLVPPGDAATLGAVLRRWLADPALRDELRAAAGHRRPLLTGWEVTTRCLTTALDAALATTPQAVLPSAAPGTPA